MHTGEEIIHTTASENLSFATGWLLFSIVLGSVLTFTLFTTISTSFYCCKKPIKKKDKGTQSLINTGNLTQKLHFPIVPSSVYPTIQSILQQEDNEVIDSLSPAYRELPSAHFTYVSSFSGSIDSTTSGNDQTTILPNSTKSSVHPYTQSSELKIQRISNDSAISQRNTSNSNPGNSSSRSIDIASTLEDPTTSQKNPSLINPDLIDDGSLSIHIITAPEDPLQYPTLSTSEMITEEDRTIQRESNKNSKIQPTINNDQLKESALNDEKSLTELAINDSRLSEPVVNDQQLNDQRTCTDRNAATTSSTNNNICDSSRGASSFGGVELSPKTRAFSPDYYALTFRREGSDVSCGSLRGASAFSGSSEQRRSPISHGASAFGQRSGELQHPKIEGCQINETKEKSNRQTGFFNITYDLNYKESQPGTRRSCTMEETGNEIKISKSTHASEINDKAAKILPPSPNHREVKTNSVYSVESNSSKLQCENQSMERLPRATANSTINKRPYSSKLNTKSYRVNVEEGERTSEIKPSSQNDSGEKNKAKSITAQLYNSSEPKKSTTLSNKHITAQQHEILDKPIKTLQTTPRDNIAPITSLQNTPRYSSKPMDNLNTTYQSLRGASQLGHLGDDDVCSDTDAFWDSVSLSFAYDSPSEEDSVSHFRFKEKIFPGQRSFLCW